MTHAYKQENAYILESIDNSGYDAKPLVTDKEKLQFLYDTFMSEYGHEVKRYGQMKALTNWLQGLPSAINIVFYNHDILELCKEFGTLPKEPTEKQEQKILNNYWQFMAMRIISLWHKNKIA